jgi:hypothetical protein
MKINGEWEFAPDELESLFAAKGWVYHTDKGLVTPTKDDLESILVLLVKEVLEDPEAHAVQGGRFMVWKDPEMPNSYDLFLNLGFIWDEEALGEDGVPA